MAQVRSSSDKKWRQKIGFDQIEKIAVIAVLPRIHTLSVF